MNQLVLSFLHTDKRINKPYWQSGEIIVLRSWRYSCFRGTYSLLDVFLMFPFVVLLGPHEIQKKKLSYRIINKEMF